MLIQMILCAYLLLTVIDLSLRGVATGQGILLLISLIHLVFFVFILVQYSTFFQHMATKEGRRIVFTPVVFFFFSLAIGLLVGTLFGATGITIRYLLISLLVTLITFSLLSSIFELFPFKSAGIQYLLRGGIVILGIGWGIQYLSMMRSELPLPTPELSTGSIAEGDTTETVGFSGDTLSLTGQADTGATLSGDAMDIGLLDGLLEPPDDGLTGEATTIVTYRTLLPYLDREIGFAPTSSRPTFSLIATADEIYPVFQRARGMNMIGTNINPDRQVGCGNLMVILGLAQDRQIDSTKSVLDAYRQEAERNDMLGGCREQDQIVTRADLPSLP